MSETLSDRVTVVTGAAGGIGRACAQAIAANGGRVVLVDRDAATLEPVAAALPGDDTLTLALDVTHEADMADMAAQTVARFGRIDALIAAAGILRLGQTLKTIADTPLDEWRAVLDVNLTGTFLSNRAVLPAMLKQRRGDIINLSSTSGRQGRPFDGPYCASKFGVIGFSESLAEEVSRQGIRVQTILPDAVDTPFWEQNGPAALRPGALLAPEQVAEFAVYLLTLPRDAYLLNPVLSPFNRRKQRKKGARP